jgi:hypothetical protein
VNVIEEILSERKRQIEVEGYTTEHDDRHVTEALMEAALCYEANAMGWDLVRRKDGAPSNWPWEASSWKPKDKRRDLIRAAALCLAENERWNRDGFPDQAFTKMVFERCVREIESLSVNDNSTG